MDVAAGTRIGGPSWVNTRTVFGLLLFVLAFVGGQRVLAAADASVQVWAAAAPLPLGAELAAEDLRPVRVGLPDDVAHLYVSSSDEIIGATLTRPVAAGELIPAAWLGVAPPNAETRVLTIPVTPEHGGSGLVPGDRIDVLATFDSKEPDARTYVLARAVEVLGLVTTGGVVLEEEAAVGVSVALSPEQAQQIAFAIRSAEIDVARVVGVPGSTTAAEAVRAADFR